MNSILSALSNRTPLVWVKTVEPERLIAKLPSWETERNIFQLDAQYGLMQWSHTAKEWEIILVTVMNPIDGNEYELPIRDPDDALMYVLEQSNSLYIMRNLHKDIDKFLTYLSVIFSRYRTALWKNDVDKLPLQFICLGAEEDPPVEIAAMTTVCNYGLPNASEIRSLVTHIVEERGEATVEGQDLEKIIEASKGMTELGLVEFYLQSIRDTGVISDEQISALKLERLKATTMLDIIRPTMDFSSIGGLDQAKEMITKVQWIHSNPELAKQYQVTPLNRFLFLGPPGVGKSMICEAAAASLGLDLARTGVSQAMNKFVGESERIMRQTFAQIDALAPIAVWIDELGRDLSGGGSSDYVDGGTTSRVHGTFLTGLQELPDNVLLFCAANDISGLPPEMLRSGRFDVLMFVGFPAVQERAEIFRIHLGRDYERFDCEELADRTSCFTGVEIKELISKTRNKISPVLHRQIETADIVGVIPELKNRVWLRYKNQMTNMYQIALVEHEWASTAQRAEAGIIATGREIQHRNVTAMPRTATLK